MSQFTSAADMADALLYLLTDEPELLSAAPAAPENPFADLDELNFAAGCRECDFDAFSILDRDAVPVLGAASHRPP